MAVEQLVDGLFYAVRALQQQRQCQDWTHLRHAAQERVPGTPCRAGTQGVGQLGAECCQLLLESTDMFLNLQTDA